MPTPSPEARARSIEKQGGVGYYVKDGVKYPNIHLNHPCGSCWQELNKIISHGNGYCNECMLYAGKLDLPWPNFSEDMKKFWNENGYLDRSYFDMKTREFNIYYKKHFKL